MFEGLKVRRKRRPVEDNSSTGGKVLSFQLDH